MNTKVKGEAIKEGSIPLSALSNKIYDRIYNILIFNDEYSTDINNPDSENDYYLVSDYNNEHIDAFKKYLYNLVKYGIAGIIVFNYAGDISYTYYCPFLTCSLTKKDRMEISNNNFSNIDKPLSCSWGLALDDHNGSSINIALKLYPKQNKLYLKCYEI